MSPSEEPEDESSSSSPPGFPWPQAKKGIPLVRDGDSREIHETYQFGAGGPDFLLYYAGYLLMKGVFHARTDRREDVRVGSKMDT